MSRRKAPINREFAIGRDGKWIAAYNDGEPGNMRINIEEVEPKTYEMTVYNGRKKVEETLIDNIKVKYDKNTGRYILYFPNENSNNTVELYKKR
jgi:hypothetical protein